MPSETDQASLFLSGEADNWFRRNQGHLSPDRVGATDWPLQLLRRSGARPRRALEVGASNGYRLECLRREYGCEVAGVEPSAAAVEHAAAEFPAVRMHRGLSHDLSLWPDGHFDLVLLCVVLHWVDRRHLLRTVAEADRVLAEGGDLLISDFYPERPHKVRYHHCPGAEAWTYKQDYPALWLSTQLYRTVQEVTFDHATGQAGADVDPSHRCRVTLLKKVGPANYPARERP
jgi:SAM-dependent methyltransferase